MSNILEYCYENIMGLLLSKIKRSVFVLNEIEWC